MLMQPSFSKSASCFNRSFLETDGAALDAVIGSSRPAAENGRTLRFPANEIHIDPASVNVQVSPVHVVKRQAMGWNGMAAEIVQVTRRQKAEFRFRSSFHLLAFYEQGLRNDGETKVEGASPSTLRDVKRKLTFVPAGHEFHEWHDPRILGRVVFFYIDPAMMLSVSDEPLALSPRIFFENAALRVTALKLMALIESGAESSQSYVEALGAVMAHELIRLDQGVTVKDAPVRGGLAAWQEKAVTAYIEEHLAETIPLAKLAELVRLSPYYFCRAFKQSFGLPPHRYHNSRRIEYAKTLLAKASPSVTDIGLAVGFSETSSFTAAFRKATGQTPTAYHRSLS